MADISKGKRSAGRRSSILKRALADIHVNINVQEKEDVKKRLSKRVSFAETCCVKEFPRDSPQFLKSTENNNADTSGDSIHLEPDLIDPSCALDQDEEQPLETMAAAGSSFVVDDGETTFVSGMAEPGGFRESTRKFDSYSFDEPTGLDVSEITREEDSVFFPAAPPESNANPSAASAKCISSTSIHPPFVINSLLGKIYVNNDMSEKSQTFRQGHVEGNQNTANQMENNQSRTQNQTVLFDDQDGGTMDLTLMDTSRGEFLPRAKPKISARDFLSKLTKGEWGNQVVKVGHVRQEQTVLFAEDGDGCTMEFTQNLPLRSTTTTVNISHTAIMPVSQNAASLPAPAEQTIHFGNRDADDSMNLTRNLSPLNITNTDENKISAKSFLASLHRSQPSVPFRVGSNPEPATLKMLNEQSENMDVTMEMTGCLDAGSKSFNQPVHTASDSFSELVPLRSLNLQHSQQELLAASSSENDLAEMMELTGCVDNTQQLLLDANSSAITATAVNEGVVSKSSSRNALVDITSRYSTSPTPPVQVVYEEEISMVMKQNPCTTGVSPTREEKNPGEGCTAGTMLPNKGFRSTRGPMVPRDQHDRASLTKASLITAEEENKTTLSRTLLKPVTQVNRTALTPVSVRQDDRSPRRVSIEQSNTTMPIHEESKTTPSRGEMIATHPVYRQVQFPSEQKMTGSGRTKLPTQSGQGSEEMVLSTVDVPSHFVKISSQNVSCDTQSDVHFTSDYQNRTIHFTAGETEAAMDMTDTMIESPHISTSSKQCFGQSRKTGSSELAGSQCKLVPTVSAQEKTLIFDEGGMKNEMSFTCLLPDSSNASEAKHNFQQKVATTSVNSTTVAKNQTVSQDESCKTMPRNANQYSHKDSFAFSKEEMAASMVKPSVDTDRNKTIAFSEEETAANMSLTCFTLPNSLSQHKPSANSDRNKTIAFSKEDTAANMSLTCAKLPNSLSQHKPSDSDRNKTIAFSKEDTAANMSLTCLKLPNSLSQHKPSDSDRNKTIAFSKEDTAANMSLTCLKLPYSLSQHKPSDSDRNKTIAFSKEDTAANMSLTCLKLPNSLSQHKPSDSDRNKTIAFSKEDTAANMSLTCAKLPCLSAQRKLSADKSVLFSAEETAANMSLDCSVPQPQYTRLEQVKKTDKSSELKSDQTHHQGDKTVIFQADQSQGMMDLTGNSPSTQSSSENDKVDNLDIQLVKIADSSNVVDIKTPTRNFGGRNSSMLVDKDLLEEENCIFKEEPTSFMKMKGILAELTKQIDEQPGETRNMKCETDRKDEEQVDKMQTPSKELECKLNDVRVGSSRKLQISSRTEQLSDSLFHQHSKKTQENVSSQGIVKHCLPNFDDHDSQPEAKQLRLSSHVPDIVESNVFPDTEMKQENSFEMKPQKTDNDTLGNRTLNSSPTGGFVKDIRATKISAKELNHKGSTVSGGSTSDLPIVILGETMPVFPPHMPDVSTAVEASMSMSVMQTPAESSMSLCKSFVDKKSFTDQPSSFLKICEELGIKQFELKGPVLRRSSHVMAPNVPCDTLEDRLNLASVTKPECEAKDEFFKNMASLLQSEEEASEELERTVMRQVSQLGLVAEAKQCPSMRKLIRGLHKAGKEHALVTWKSRKAYMLNSLTETMKVHYQVAADDLSDMIAGSESMAAMVKNVRNGIGKLQGQIDSLQTRSSSRKRSIRHHHKHQQLQQKQSELDSLQERISESKSMAGNLDQKMADLQAEMMRSQQRYEANLERQKHMVQAHDMLSTLHSIHCWRPVRIEEQQLDFSLLYDAVLLTVMLSGPLVPQQSVTQVTSTSQLRDGSEPWAQLATRLTVDALSANSQRFVDTFATREQLPQLLDEVTVIVEDIKALCLEVKYASFKHNVTIQDKQVTVELWCSKRLRKVSLSVSIPCNGCFNRQLTWLAHTIMGDISESHILKIIDHVGAGRKHFTAVLKAVHKVIHQ